MIGRLVLAGCGDVGWPRTSEIVACRLPSVAMLEGHCGVHLPTVLLQFFPGSLQGDGRRREGAFGCQSCHCHCTRLSHLPWVPLDSLYA